jgi:hypothetical protein
MYRDLIRQTLARLGALGADPRHVEAWMRLEHSRLDHLSAAAFAREVALAVECIRASTSEENDSLAASMLA